MCTQNFSVSVGKLIIILNTAIWRSSVKYDKKSTADANHTNRIQLVRRFVIHIISLFLTK